MSAGTTRLGKTKRKACMLALALAGTGLATGAGAAVASSGGDGGVSVPDPPEITDVTCSARCLDLRVVTETGTIEVIGSDLDSTAAVRLAGIDRKLVVDPLEVTETSVRAKVPVGARNGKVALITDSGIKTASPSPIEVEPADSIEDVEGFTVRTAEATPEKSFFNAAQSSELNYLFEADRPTDVRVDVIAKDTGETVDSVVQEDQDPFANHSFDWNGLDSTNGVAPNGDYQFKVSPLSGGPGAGARFSYYDHFFPLRGKHEYGDGLGAGRGHQGQDVFAKCGTEIVAARGGRVQVSSFHEAAGNYVVIDGRKTGQDYVYMHMEERGLPREGSRVKTGDIVGYESDTGRATGCHLHFELWSAPGWYEGGHVLDPTPSLKKWDRWS